MEKQYEEEFQEREERLVSLYDIARQAREGEFTPIARLLYVGYCNESLMQSLSLDLDEATRKLKENTERYFKERGEETVITGFFMVKHMFFLHILEGESHVMNHLLQDLHKEFKGGKSYYQIINVIVFSEENPERYFTEWKSDSNYPLNTPINLENEKDQSFVTEKTWEIYNMLCEAA